MSVAFRVDCSSEIGSGHLIRCIRLSKSLKKNNKNIYFIICESDYLSEIKSLILKENIKLILINNKKKNFSYKSDAESTIKILKKKKIKNLVVDNYKIDRRWEEKVKKYTEKLIVIDDLANRKHYCDILIDQNYVQNYKTRYDKITNKNCLKLLGPKFCITNKIKKTSDHNAKQEKKEIRRIFIFFSAVFIPRIFKMIVDLFSTKKLKKISVDFVIGNLEKKKFLILRKTVNRNIKLMTGNKNLQNLMSKADLAIGSGGTNTWERISLGLPSIVFCIAQNQRKICEFLNKKKIIKYLGYFNNKSRSKLNRELINIKKNYKNINIKSKENKYLIDRFGKERINFFINNKLKEKIVLKKATLEDMDLMFSWANDELVRKNSFIKKKIKYSDHKKWFKRKVLSKKSLIYKLLLNNIPIGQVRYDKKNNSYEIDYSIDELFRNRGYGKIIIKKSIKKIFKKKTIIRANVKTSNKKSIDIFKSLKFKQIKSSSIKSKFELLSSEI